MTPRAESVVWREIPGWEGFYAVSSRGEVKSLARSVRSRPGVKSNLRERLLRPRSVSGYRRVKLCRDGAIYDQGVHRLVLLAFVGPCPEGMEACHNDGDRSNNALSNLRWDTKAANMADKLRHGNNHFANLTHCSRGHELTPENVYRPPSNPRTRMCRECLRIRRQRARGAAA